MTNILRKLMVRRPLTIFTDSTVSKVTKGWHRQQLVTWEQFLSFDPLLPDSFLRSMCAIPSVQFEAMRRVKTWGGVHVISQVSGIVPNSKQGWSFENSFATCYCKSYRAYAFHAN